MTARAGRSAAALVVLLGMLVGFTACGMDAQTLRPYTPSEGVNLDVGDNPDLDLVVHVRNLMVISKEPGSGVVSASMVTDGSDELTAVSGVPLKTDGTEGTPYTARVSSPVALKSRVQVVLTDLRQPISVQSPDLEAGLTTQITLSFRKAGEVTVLTTVVDGNVPQYASISPAPSSSPSA
jgi:hypothetical protein